MLLLILDQLLLRGFHLHLQVRKLLLQPVGSLHGGFKARFEVLLDVGIDQRVDDARGKFLVWALIADVDNARVISQCHVEVALESAEQPRSLRRIWL